MLKQDKKLIEQFLNNLYGEDKSENTITNYRVDLSMLSDYLEKQEIKILDADLQTLESFRTHLRRATYANGKNYSASTRARRITSVRVFYDYLYTRDVIASNPAEKLTIPQQQKGVQREFISEEEALRVIEATKGATHETRDRLILRLFLTTGMRLSELANLNISDIKGSEVTINGKGNKQRKAYITKDLSDELVEYVESREIKSDNLFLSQKNNRLSERAIQRAIKKYMGKAGVDTDKYSTHSLRHNFASVMLSKGVDIVTIQQALGHSSLETTQKYAHTTKETRQKAANVMANIYS